MSLLHYAAIFGHENVVAVLLNNGANINFVDKVSKQTEAPEFSFNFYYYNLALYWSNWEDLGTKLFLFQCHSYWYTESFAKLSLFFFLCTSNDILLTDRNSF